MQIYFLLFFLLISFSNQISANCEDLEWIKDQGRTQGGGWIWFPGMAENESIETARLMAEGEGVRKLVQECGFAHKEVKIHERCEEEWGKGHRVFVRLSLLDKQCKETRYASKERTEYIYNSQLMQVYEQYLKLIGRPSVLKQNDCSKGDGKQCYELGKYYHNISENKLASKFFVKGCEKKHLDSCFNAGVVFYAQGNFNKAKGYLSMACEKKDAVGCWLLGEILLKSNVPDQSKLFFQKSCQLNYPKGCLDFGYFQRNVEKNLMASKISFDRSCHLGNADGCHELSIYYFDLKDSDLALGYSARACSLGLSKGCYNQGMFYERDKKEDLAQQYYDKSCQLNLANGCFKSAILLRKEGVSAKVLERHIQGCNLGNGESCHEASVYYFDKKDYNGAYSLAQLACKLKIEKSCKNLSFLNGKTKT